MIRSLWRKLKPDSRVGNGSSNSIQCLACNRKCIIPKGEAGFCGVRANEDERLKLLVYGRPSAVWIDPIEKKPFYHVIPGTTSYSIGTFGCDFACDFCQNWDLSQAPMELRHKDPKGWRKYFEGLLSRVDYRSPSDVVNTAVETGCSSIAFTYNEPTIFTEYAVDIMKLAKKENIKTLYVTNGYESPEAWKVLHRYGLTAANIDLKAFTEEFYHRHIMANLEPVKESIILAKKYKIWVELTTLLIPGENDSPNEIKQAVDWIVENVGVDTPWHFTAFYPQYKQLDTPPTPPTTLLKARDIARMGGIKFVYIGNVGSSYQNYESTYCPKCNKLLIKRNGFGVYENKLKNGKCPKCGETIPGVWK